MARSPETQLGYLLKHAHLRYLELHDAALSPLGIDGRELGILLVVADGEPRSQQQVAERLGIDRTSMVAFLDALEAKGLIARRPHTHDRRRNVIELTPSGEEVVGRALEVGAALEATFLAALSGTEAGLFRKALGELVDEAP